MGDNNMMKIAYFVGEPETPVNMYEIDARQAVARFPDEWSFSPWKIEAPKATVSDAPLEGPRRGPNAVRA